MGTHPQITEEIEMRVIHSMRSGMPRREIASAFQRSATTVVHGEVENELRQISTVFDEKAFCKRLIGSVQVATSCREDADRMIERRKASSVLSNDRH